VTPRYVQVCTLYRVGPSILTLGSAVSKADLAGGLLSLSLLPSSSSSSSSPLSFFFLHLTSCPSSKSDTILSSRIVFDKLPPAYSVPAAISSTWPIGPAYRVHSTPPNHYVL
jgi:hypothetical protein